MTTPHPSLADKAAPVAGGTRGAGRGIAVRLGAAVHVTGRSAGGAPEPPGPERHR